MHVWKPIAALLLAACLASGPARADSKGVVQVGITIVHGCSAGATQGASPAGALQVQCTGRVPYRVSIAERPAEADYRTVTVAAQHGGVRVATLTF